MRASHSPAIGSAASAPRFPIRIAAGVSSPLARRDRRGVLILRSAGLIQFRSAAVGAASLIAGALRAIGARIQRVFAVIQKVSVCGSLHVDQSDLGKFADVRKAFGVLRNA